MYFNRSLTASSASESYKSRLTNVVRVRCIERQWTVPVCIADSLMLEIRRGKHTDGENNVMALHLVWL